MHQLEKLIFEVQISNRQGWEKSIVIDIRLRYSLLFVHRMHWGLYFFQWVSIMALSLLFFFRRNSIFRIRFFLSMLLYLTLVNSKNNRPYVITRVSSREVGTRNFPKNLGFWSFSIPGKFMSGSREFFSILRVSVVLIPVIPTQKCVHAKQGWEPEEHSGPHWLRNIFSGPDLLLIFEFCLKIHNIMSQICLTFTVSSFLP